ncbi:MAG TPA: LacI family DNA-binding transcriptional regulator [Ruminiclostridium sp.]
MKITIRDVAREAGVSISTVSYALNKVGELTKPTHKRVLEAAERLGYVPDPTARSLVMGTTNSIGIVIPPNSTFDLDNPYTLQMLSSLSRLLSDINYWMSVSIPQSVEEQSTKHFLVNSKIDGLIWLESPLPKYVSKVMLQRRLPCIDIGYGKNINATILVEDDEGIKQAIDYLYSLGHKRIMFISGYEDEEDNSRLLAYNERMSELGVSYHQVIVGDFNEKATYNAILDFLSKTKKGSLPTAILAASDLMAIGVLKALDKLSIKVPEEMSVMGFDDIPAASDTYPPLTTMKQPIDFIMRTACEHIFASIKGEDVPLNYKIFTKLIVRKSTAYIKS